MKNFTEGKFKKDNLVEVWGDIVALKELMISIIISVVLGMIGYFLAPEGNSVFPLLFAIVGIIIATIINSLIFKPKRIIQLEEQSVDNQEEVDE